MEKTTPQTLDFTTLVPTEHIFKDVDGQEYPFKSRYAFGAVDYARMQGLENKAQAAADRIKAEAGDQEKAAREIENAFRALTHMLIPTLAPQRIDEMSIMQMQAIWQWWQHQEAPELETEPEGDAQESPNGAEPGEVTPDQ